MATNKLSVKAVNREAVILEWVRSNENLPSYPLLNLLREKPESCAVISVPSATAKKYINHTQANPSCVRRYDFALTQTHSLSDATDSVNTDAMYEMRQWVEWIGEQEAAKNYPDFGKNTKMILLEVLDDVPIWTQVSPDTVKLMLQARLTYIEKGV